MCDDQWSDGLCACFVREGGFLSFLDLDGKTIVLFGIANKKSVAFHIGDVLAKEGTKVVYVVRSEARRESLGKLIPGAEIFLCDVEYDEQIERVAKEISQRHPVVHGIVHSIAFA